MREERKGVKHRRRKDEGGKRWVEGKDGRKGENKGATLTSASVCIF